MPLRATIASWVGVGFASGIHVLSFASNIVFSKSPSPLVKSVSFLPVMCVEQTTAVIQVVDRRMRPPQRQSSSRIAMTGMDFALYCSQSVSWHQAARVARSSLWRGFSLRLRHPGGDTPERERERRLHSDIVIGPLASEAVDPGSDYFAGRM